MSRLNDLLRRAATIDPKLGSELEAEVGALTDRRSFGLVFEPHLPEAVALPGRPVRRGDKVRVVGESADIRLWEVDRVRRRDAVTGKRMVELVDDTGQPRPGGAVDAEELTVFAEFGDPIYPGLRLDGQAAGGEESDPWHTVITAENSHALELLRYTHKGGVDAIYIDPPYNTGSKDWIYNDAYVEGTDHYRHSKWLAFMERRLVLAKDLLAPHGVIIVAIGHQEHHRLRMLLDQTFGAQNFLADLVWDSPGSNSGKTAAGGVDYMLVYAQDAAKHFEWLPEGRWLEPRAGQQEMLELVAQVRAEGGTVEEARKKLRAWVNKARKADEIPAGAAMYNQVDDQWRVFQSVSLTGPGVRPNLVYPIKDPNTGKEYWPPKGGSPRWVWSQDRMKQAVAKGLIYFGGDVPRQKRFLDEQTGTAPRSVFEVRRARSTKHLDTVLGERRFPFPKDHEVLQRWLGVVTGWRKDVTILDFFGGSGSTAEAVMRLNAADDGQRKAILVTNNELEAKKAAKLVKQGLEPGDPEWERWGVAQHVTRPRLTTVATGVREDGSVYEDPTDSNVRFFTLTYEDPKLIRHGRALDRIAPVLWLRAGQQGPVIDAAALGTVGWAVNPTYGVITDTAGVSGFLGAVQTHEPAEVFVITDDDAAFARISAELPEGTVSTHLYENYLQNFRINRAGDLALRSQVTATTTEGA